MIPFPFEPLASKPSIVEGISFRTDVITARNDKEQRRQLRETPRRSIEFTSICTTPREAQHGNLLLYGNQANRLGVPLWQHVERLTAQATAGASALSLDVDDIPWLAGDGVFLFREPFVWELATLSSVGADQLNLTGPLASTWPAGTLVAPMRPGFIAAETPFTWNSRDHGRCRARFILDPDATLFSQTRSAGSPFDEQPSGVGWGGANDGISALDGSPCTCGNGTTTLGSGGAVSQGLEARYFGFAVPLAAVIVGVAARYARKYSGAVPLVDSVQLSLDDVGGGEEKGGSTFPTVMAYRAVGGATDLWQRAITPALVNDNGFGLDIRATNPDPGTGASIAYIDHVEMTVFYRMAA